MFDQRFTRLVQEKALASIQATFAADPILKNVGVAYGGGSIGAARNDATLKFVFLNTAAKPTAALGLELTDDTVREGLAEAGVEVMHGNKRYRIVKARQSRYLATCLEDGKNYTIPFRNCHLAQ